MRKIRVLVANRPRLMRELVLATIADQPDIEVVGETQNESEIAELVDTTRPDFLIIALDQTAGRPELCGFLLGRYPGMKVLAVAPQENSSIFVFSICGHSCQAGRNLRARTAEVMRHVMRKRTSFISVLTTGDAA